ncbi:MAG TPA: cytochrome c-type biogenesis protein CcmH [Solirubrobacteraceae bacterium]|nr:cytochrome c-type biogenesis protein CcmH [Solirubrobacteraceae bacterium]
MRTRAAVAIVLAAVLGGSPSALAAACPRTSALAVESEVMCTVCGTPLLEATEAPEAQRERAFILRQVQACRTKGQIKAALAEEFGPAVLALPPTHGRGIAAYLIPALAALLGIALVSGAAARWRRRGAAEPAPAALPVLTPTDVDRLEADLLRYRG